MRSVPPSGIASIALRNRFRNSCWSLSASPSTAGRRFEDALHAHAAQPQLLGQEREGRVGDLLERHRDALRALRARDVEQRLDDQ